MIRDERRTSWQADPIKDARGRSVLQLDPVIMHLTRRHDVIPSGNHLLVVAHHRDLLGHGQRDRP
ncbi:MAG: hypothetical protein ACYSUF_02110 [Planctomycetota bacterium]